jgi:3-hydroxyisobutyrate dehydrogenase
VKTAFIGLGSQGGPMAQRMLGAGYPLMVWARRVEVLEPFVAQGAVAARSIAELGREADHVGVCVVDDAGVAQICEELLPVMQPGSVLAIHSTILPESCVSLARRCAERGIAFVDAPVSGGGAAAAEGRLTVMCGASPADFEKARPVMESFAAVLVRLGMPGAGQRAKIVNNTLMAAHMGLAHAALGVGEALGIERQALAELIKASSGRSFGFEVYARLRRPSAFDHGARLLRKDVDLLDAISSGNPHVETLCRSAHGFLDPALEGLSEVGA